MKNIKLRIITLLIISFSLPFLNEVIAQEEKKETDNQVAKIPVNLAVSYYFDSREYNTLGINYNRSQLPGGLKLWGFVDFHGLQRIKGNPEDPNRTSAHDLTDWFTENRLIKMIDHGFGVELEYNDANGTNNNTLRFGVVYTLPISGQFIQLRIHPFETDGDGGQASIGGSINLWQKKLFLEGFYDHNFNNHNKHSHKHKSDRQVSEVQLRYMVDQNLGLLCEYRVNEFLRNAIARKHRKGIAFGLTYRF